MRSMKRFLKVLIPAVFLLSVSLSIPASTAIAQGEEFPQSNAWFEASPSVVWCGDTESSITLEVHIVGRNDVQRVWVTNLFSSAAEAEREFFDDGTNGDLTAGDNVFTLTLAVNNLPCDQGLITAAGGFMRWNGFIRVELTNGTKMGNWYVFAVGLVDQKYRDAFEVVDLGDGLFATKYAFFIEDTEHEVMDDYPVSNVVCGTANYVAYQKFYSVMPDEFDFALVMPGMQIFHPGDLGENVPYSVAVSNNVGNIGMPIFDRSATFGSQGRLKHTIFHSFGAIAIVDHEIGHAWGMSIGSSLGLISALYGGDDNPHWSEYSDIEGQMGAYYFDSTSASVGHFSYNDDETWSLVLNSVDEPYSPLELYVMGLIPSDEVPPIHVLSSPDLSNPNRITAVSYKTVTIEEIVQSSGGERIPPASEAQKDFTLAFIVTQDVPFNDAAFAFFSLMSHDLISRGEPREHSYSAPFFWATGGRGTLDTTLPLDLAVPANLPGDPTPTAEPTNTSQPVPVSTEEVAPTETKPASKFPFCGGIIGVLGLALTPTAFKFFKKRRQS